MKTTSIKALRDLTNDKARSLFAVAAIAIGVFASGSLFLSYAILDREIERSTRIVNSATIVSHLAKATPEQARVALTINGVENAEIRSQTTKRFRKDNGESAPILLTILPDFETIAVDSFFPESGSFNPTTGEILIERSTTSVIERNLGEEISIESPNGSSTNLKISGIVHDPGKAPGWMDGIAYGYISQSTAQLLGLNKQLDELRIVTTINYDPKTIGATLRERLEANGANIHSLSFPPPDQHPHQGQMLTYLFLLLSFGTMVLATSTALVFMLVSAIMGQQARQIGVMKSFGASKWHIARIYLSSTFILSLFGTTIALPCAIWLAKVYSEFSLSILNFEAENLRADPWAYSVPLSAGLLIPFLAALIPIWNACKVTPRQAIANYGIHENSSVVICIEKILSRLSFTSWSTRLAIRNSFRRSGRLALTVLALASGGMILLTALNTQSSLTGTFDQQFSGRKFDASLKFENDHPTKQILEQVNQAATVAQSESWISKRGHIKNFDTGISKSIRVKALPADNQLLNLEITKGRWLRDNDSNAVVLSHTLATGKSPYAVGGAISLTVDGKTKPMNVVGIARWIGGDVVFTNKTPFANWMGQPEMANQIVVQFKTTDTETKRSNLIALESDLQQSGISISSTDLTSNTRQDFEDHLLILVYLLLGLAALVIAIGFLGFSSAMSLNIIERTREIGVMKAVGAKAGAIIALLIKEALFTGLLSWTTALAFAIPISKYVTATAGNIFFYFPMNLLYSKIGVAIWLVVALSIAATATYFPARKALRQTARDALSYE